MQNNLSGNSFSHFLKRGGAGILTVLLILLLFILCATWLKSLIAGIALAALCLPLEKWFEQHWFPVKKDSEDPENQKKRKDHQILKSTLAAVSVVAVLFLLCITLIIAFLIPYAVETGKNVSDWAKNNTSLEQAEQKLAEWISENHGPDKENVLQSIRQAARQAAQENKEKLAAFAFSGGSGFVGALLRFCKRLGTFAFGLLLTFFFCFYFLQKLALFESAGKQNGGKTAEWCVNTLFQSSWLPEVSDETKKYAAEVLGHIMEMLGKWMRGYLTIIAIEVPLYIVLMTIAGVPYALLAGAAAGMTILLPIVGLIISLILTAGLCFAFCEGNLLITLLAAALIYVAVCAFEQMYLYPRCVGGALGLTIVETIIVVLISGMLFGVAGMVLAVPCAAVIKYLIPAFYHAALDNKSRDGNV